MLALVFTGGSVVDGTGAPARSADVAITGGVITEVGAVKGKARETVDADGALGDYRPMTALAEAVTDFSPDRIVIATLPVDTSAWLRFDVVERARATYEVPVTHVVAESMTATR